MSRNMSQDSRTPFAATMLVLMAALAAASLAQGSKATALKTPLADIAKDIAGWTLSANAALDSLTLEQLKPTSYLSRTYQKDQRQLDLLIVYYAQQRAGESMHSPEHCLPGGGWRIDNRESVVLPLDGRPVKVNRYRISHGTQNEVMYYWYQSQRRVIATEYMGKALLVWDSIASGHTEGTLVRITSQDDAREFASAALAEMQRRF